MEKTKKINLVIRIMFAASLIFFICGAIFQYYYLSFFLESFMVSWVLFFIALILACIHKVYRNKKDKKSILFYSIAVGFIITVFVSLTILFFLVMGAVSR